MLWKQQTGHTVCGYSLTRWWSRWELINQILELFGDVEPFLRSLEEFSANTRAKLIEFYENVQKCHSLKVELACVVDAGKPFVQATYKLEGDGLLAVDCHEVISSLSTSVKLENYPNLQAVVKSIAKGKLDVQQKWLQYANTCIKPALDYYSQHLKADLMSGPLNAFKAARLFSPLNIQKTKPECTALSSLLAFPFITESLLAALKEEFPQYVALAEDVSPDYDIIRF